MSMEHMILASIRLNRVKGEIDKGERFTSGTPGYSRVHLDKQGNVIITHPTIDLNQTIPGHVLALGEEEYGPASNEVGVVELGDITERLRNLQVYQSMLNSRSYKPIDI